MEHKRRRRSYWIASLALVLVCSCTPREIEQQDAVLEMPRPGGSDQHRLDSIKRELNIKRGSPTIQQQNDQR